MNAHVMETLASMRHERREWSDAGSVDSTGKKNGTGGSAGEEVDSGSGRRGAWRITSRGAWRGRHRLGSLHWVERWVRKWG